MSMEPETNDPRIADEASEQAEAVEAEAAAEAETLEEAAEAAVDTEESAADEKEAADEKKADDEKPAEADAEHAQPRSGKRTIAALIAILASIGILGAIAFFIVRGLPGHGAYALKISNTEYSLGEVNFTYRHVFEQMYSQYGMYTPDMLPDDPYTMGDGELDTWGDFYMDQTKKQLQQITVFYEKAVEDGFELGETETKEIESYIQSLKDSAEQSGAKDFDTFLAENYGEGVTEDSIRTLLTREVTAATYLEHYQDSLEYSEEDIEAAYQADKDTYDTYSFAVYMVEPEAEEGASPTEEQLAAATEKANAIVEQAQDGDGEAIDRLKAAAGSEDLVESYDMDGGTIASNQIPFEAWLKDPARKAGDMTVSEESGYGAFVVLFEGRERDDTPTVDVRHILIQAEDTDGDGEISDAEYETAKAKIEDIRAEWEAGEKTEESFAALAEQYSADPGSSSNGGLYEGVVKGQMVESFNDYCFDPERKPGDVGVVQNTTHKGYHLIYFVGKGESYTAQIIKDALTSDEVSSFFEKMTSELPEAVEGKDFEKVALPAKLLEQLQAAKDAYNNYDYSDLPAEDETGADEELQDIVPEEELEDAPAEAPEENPQESAAP